MSDFFKNFAIDIAEMNKRLSGIAYKKIVSEDDDIAQDNSPENLNGHIAGNYRFEKALYCDGNKFDEFLNNISKFYSKRFTECQRYALVGQAGIGKSTFFANIGYVLSKNEIKTNYDAVTFEPENGGLVVVSFRFCSHYTKNEDCRLISSCIDGSLHGNKELIKYYNQQLMRREEDRFKELERERIARADQKYKFSEFDLLVHRIENYTFALYPKVFAIYIRILQFLAVETIPYRGRKRFYRRM